MVKTGTQVYMEGLRLLGNVVRFKYCKVGTGVRCIGLHDNGMVELEGHPGLFAPHLLEIDGEVTAVPVMGEVQ